MAPINNEGTMTLNSKQFERSFDEISHREDMRVLDEMGAEFERADRERASSEARLGEPVRKADVVKNDDVYHKTNEVNLQQDLAIVRNIGDRLAVRRDMELAA